MLTEMIRAGEDPEGAGERHGRRQAAAGGSAGDAVEAIAAAMARDGFDPEVRTRRGRTEIVLRTCPYAEAAVADPDIVCALHLGLARGVAAGRTVEVDELVRKDPRRARCVLRLTVTP
jgi:predicted ArsR family transcriptional regulator